jgi:Zn-dependent protease with chaperone function
VKYCHTASLDPLRGPLYDVVMPIVGAAHNRHHHIIHLRACGALSRVTHRPDVQIVDMFIGLSYHENTTMSLFARFTERAKQALVAFFGCIRLLLCYSRYQEYQADEFALRTTRKVQAFKNAITRLTNLRSRAATSAQNARHSTHPTLVKRLQHANEFPARQMRFVMPEQG